MSFAFKGSEKFNGDLSKWQTTSATSMDEMFSGALSFTGSSLGEWDTSSVVSMSGMFEDAISFN
jgi:surface protein